MGNSGVYGLWKIIKLQIKSTNMVKGNIKFLVRICSMSGFLSERPPSGEKTYLPKVDQVMQVPIPINKVRKRSLAISNGILVPSMNSQELF